MSETGPMDMAARLVLNMLSPTDIPTTADIRSNVALVVTMLEQKGTTGLDAEALVRDVETRCMVFVPAATVMDDDGRDHKEWLPARRGDVDWRFWERYRRYLEDVVDLPPAVVRELGDISDNILGRLEDPQRPAPWDRRGLVVGQVQSGKTGNYIGLMCKAADAGYRFMVVLAGTHNSLRSQTQLRLNAGFLGFDTARSMSAKDQFRMGVGRLPGAELYEAHSLTSSLDRGDFKLSVAQNAGIIPGGSAPLLLVVKKNGRILDYLLTWATQLAKVDPASGRKSVTGVPLLVIDDEADNASINTNPVLDDAGNPDPEYDPTRINALIRQLLLSFDKRAYVGYTATPFANIFIAEDVIHEEFGADLFPRSFIISLRPPTNYLGPANVFGMMGDSEAGIEPTKGLPIVREISDYSTWMPAKHNTQWQPGELPDSLEQAIRAFILVVAARMARGQRNVHNSMLIHVTRFNKVQALITDQIKEALTFLQRRLSRGDGRAGSQLVDELRQLWENDFVPTSSAFDNDPTLLPVTWELVQAELHRAASRIEVRAITGKSPDVLAYIDHEDTGLSVIAVGGDKLSRGLTLEGLSVSYYLRFSKMYDTLLQMGRWFGYRAGYADLTRLYTSADLVGWYRHIATADEELRLLFEDMVAQGSTPRDYGLRVRNHPDGLLITAEGKMRTGQKVKLTFSHDLTSTVRFPESVETIHRNLTAVEALVRTIESRYKRVSERNTHGNFVWDGVSGELVASFLTDYVTHPKAPKVRSDLIQRYLRGRMADGELIDWTVALISNHDGDPGRIDRLDVGLTVRTWEGGTTAIGTLASPADETLDLDRSEYDHALAETRRKWELNPKASKRTTPPDLPAAVVVRRIRPATRGLLLLYPLRPPADIDDTIVGFAISFPKSDRLDDDSAIEYTLNLKAWQQEFELDV